jgi:hypothetical protein
MNGVHHEIIRTVNNNKNYISSGEYLYWTEYISKFNEYTTHQAIDTLYENNIMRKPKFFDPLTSIANCMLKNKDIIKILEPVMFHIK